MSKLTFAVMLAIMGFLLTTMEWRITGGMLMGIALRIYVEEA